MKSQAIKKLIDDILRIEEWNQETLANEIGVTQPAVARWRNEQSTPRPRHLSKLLKIYAAARAHHWASNQFVPICAIAESYPPELPALAIQALGETLTLDPLTGPLKLSPDNYLIDLHIRPAKLPKGVHAYAFANDRFNPSVFVILVQERKTYAEQRSMAWKEVYAHIAQHAFENDEDSGSQNQLSSSSLYESKLIIRHYSPEGIDHENTKDEN